MRLAGRVAAAIEILTDIFTQHRPASEALKDWGKAHRFAGSTDRHAIGTLVYDVLRRRNTAASRMGDGRPRALVLGCLRDVWNLSAAEIEALCTEQFGPGVLSGREKTALEREMRDDLPAAIRGDYPEWLEPSLIAAFGDHVAEEGAALAQRAPIDLRVNSLKASRAQVLEALGKHGAVAGPLSPLCVRIESSGIENRNVNVEVEPAHGLGWFEVQDAASQIAALMSGVQPGETVADICAGAGGKTLALAAIMKNKGRLIAHDQDKHRLRPIFERINRSGASCIEIVAADEGEKLSSFGGFDCVVIDAPCSGSGAWRRKPDAKWRLQPKQLEQRQKDQRDVLAQGAGLVKAGGRLIYITCSVLPEENTEQVKAFLAKNKDFKIIPYTEQWKHAVGGVAPKSADGNANTLLLSPLQHGTDGFFVAVMQKTV
ncbi:MAG: RsmB/NOP family class I SAM-dependent RNA methyltransferase [Alphaproteobacteria bacterium]|nr:RsmB/NOP family class I SAM-dependent RNA methyltransferase [Alphaproteobacteria bacterium]